VVVEPTAKSVDFGNGILTTFGTGPEIRVLDL
jgi:hypothetical protein